MVVLVCKDTCTLQSIQPMLSCPKFCFEAFCSRWQHSQCLPMLISSCFRWQYAFCRVQGTHNFGWDYFRSTSLVTIGIQWDRDLCPVLFQWHANEHEGISRVIWTKWYIQSHLNKVIYQESSEQSDISRVIWTKWRWLHRNLTQCSCKCVLHMSPSFLGMKVHHLEIAKLKLFCVIYA